MSSISNIIKGSVPIISPTNLVNSINSDKYKFGCIIFYLFQDEIALRDKLFKNAISQLIKQDKILHEFKNKPEKYNEIIKYLNEERGVPDAKKVFAKMMEQTIIDDLYKNNNNAPLRFGKCCMPKYAYKIFGDNILNYLSISDDIVPVYDTLLLKNILKNITINSTTINEKNVTVNVFVNVFVTGLGDTTRTYSTTHSTTHSIDKKIYTFGKNKINAQNLKKWDINPGNLYVQSTGVQSTDVQSTGVPKIIWVGEIILEEGYSMSIDYNQNKNVLIKIHYPGNILTINGTWDVMESSDYHTPTTIVTKIRLKSFTQIDNIPRNHILKISSLLIIGLMNLDI